MDGTGSGSCQTERFSISGVEPSGSATRVLVKMASWPSEVNFGNFIRVNIVEISKSLLNTVLRTGDSEIYSQLKIYLQYAQDFNTILQN
jgi:hypothetical protein